ncbi:MAG: hypothetical protein RBR08_15145 [Desulforegulaceae bacterium]|nr:hypothetical protein [Desulforegulaceae bacterium]
MLTNCFYRPYKDGFLRIEFPATEIKDAQIKKIKSLGISLKDFLFEEIDWIKWDSAKWKKLWHREAASLDAALNF